MKRNTMTICVLMSIAALAGCGKPAEPERPAQKAQPATPTEGIPETMREPGRLWCKEHNRYEDRCWICHPELQDKNRLYCEEHGLYEDECFLCHPQLKPAGQTGSERLMCNEHGVYEDECGICHPELAGTLRAGSSLKVRFGSAAAAAKAGIETAPTQAGPMTHGIDCYAEIEFDQTRLAHVSSPVAGIVQSVEVDLGSNVEERAVLAQISSTTIAEAVTKAILAGQTVDRERKLRAERISSEQDLQQAEAAHMAAYQQLRTLGFDDAQIEQLPQTVRRGALLELRAPFGGEVVQLVAVRGALVEAGTALFTVADRSKMWAMLNIAEHHLGRVRAGQTVEVRVESLPGQTFTGTLTWIAATVDDRTRMARARAEIANIDGLLRAKMFATARILTDTHEERAIVVPQSAIQQVEGRPFVFVKLTGDLYEARPVVLGAKQDGQVEILRGIEPNDRVVVARSFLLKSQLLISRLGAGCAD
jgi:cobalt-zinc-cadmium efflux system membrane fusion protein